MSETATRNLGTAALEKTISDDKKWVRTLPPVLVLLEKPGRCESLAKEPGRPGKEKTEPDQPKSPGGRPRKIQISKETL